MAAGAAEVAASWGFRRLTDTDYEAERQALFDAHSEDLGFDGVGRRSLAEFGWVGKGAEVKRTGARVGKSDKVKNQEELITAKNVAQLTETEREHFQKMLRNGVKDYKGGDCGYAVTK